MVLVLLALFAHAGITVEPLPTAGADIVLQVTDSRGDPQAGRTVRAIRRPGLAGSDEVAIGITDGQGQVRWTPERGGVTELRAGEDRLRVPVGWVSPPTGTLLVWVLLLLAALAALTHGLWPRRP